MYPPGMAFPKNRKNEYENVNIFRHRQHWAHALTPFDACATFQPARLGLPYYQHRIFILPNTRGVGFNLLNGYHYTGDHPITDPKVIQARLKQFFPRLIFVTQMFDQLHKKWKKDVMAILDQQRSLYNEIQDMPEQEAMGHFAEVRGITSARALIENYNKAVTLYLKIQEGYQYTFIGLAYGTDMALTDFCKKAFPDITDQEVAKLTTGAELEAFRPDNELKQLAKLAVELKLASLIKEANDFGALKSKFEKTSEGKKWLAEFERRSYPWFYMMVTEGVFPYCDDQCWIENPNIILGFLKNYIAKIEKGEKLERNVEGLIADKKNTFKKYYDMLKTETEKSSFKDLWDAASRLYIAVEEQILYVKNFNFALFRKNVLKFAEILAKHGVIKEPRDIFYLRFDEIGSALEELGASWGYGEPPDDYFIKEIEWRKGVLKKFREWESVQPMFLGPWKEKTIDPFFVMHGGVTLETVERYRKQIQRQKVEEIKGFAASPGVAEGPANVIHESKDIINLKPGEILVCPHTQPAWTPAFSIVKAVVTDTGGMVSHAAIVSREYGIPAVVGAFAATKNIKTGDWIKVDGNAGVVSIKEKPT